MQYGRVNGRDENAIYEMLYRRAKGWFRRSLGCDAEDIASFRLWLRATSASWLLSEDILLFLVQKKATHIIEVHPVILCKKCRNDLWQQCCDMLQYLFALGWHRIEVPVTENGGHVIRRLLGEVGFIKEGTLHHAQKGMRLKDNHDGYLDVDLWAIVEKGE